MYQQNNPPRFPSDVGIVAELVKGGPSPVSGLAILNPEIYHLELIRQLFQHSEN
jgi:hypothetical protein